MTKTLRKLTLLTLAFALAAVSFTACNDDDNNIPDNAFTYRMVTFEAQNDNGSVFTYQEGEYTPVITLTATQRIDTEKVKIGQRLVIAYRDAFTPGDASDGNISLVGYVPVHNGVLERGTSNDSDGFRSNMVQMASEWITGKWLNINMSAILRSEPKSFRLVADESTLNEEYPSVYLLFQTDDQDRGTLKTVYASFDIEWLWSDDNPCKGFILKTANQNGPHDFQFDKRPKITPAD
ncbi:MAG: NigD-like C-terminal domain-containing protein [Bacteroidales bacterium]|nr:NigD-like C-terminal domain-containing protein [Bacteroidales bacterium]